MVGWKMLNKPSQVRTGRDKTKGRWRGSQNIEEPLDSVWGALPLSHRQRNGATERQNVWCLCEWVCMWVRKRGEFSSSGSIPQIPLIVRAWSGQNLESRTLSGFPTCMAEVQALEPLSIDSQYALKDRRIRRWVETDSDVVYRPSRVSGLTLYATMPSSPKALKKK